MEATANHLNILLKVQFASALFIVFLLIQTYFIGELPNLFGVIIEAIKQVLVIPAIILTIMCFVIAIGQVLFKRKYNKQSILLLSISSFCVILIIASTINDL